VVDDPDELCCDPVVDVVETVPTDVVEELCEVEEPLVVDGFDGSPVVEVVPATVEDPALVVDPEEVVEGAFVVPGALDEAEDASPVVAVVPAAAVVVDVDDDVEVVDEDEPLVVDDVEPPVVLDDEEAELEEPGADNAVVEEPLVVDFEAPVVKAPVVVDAGADVELATEADDEDDPLEVDEPDVEDPEAVK